LLKVGLKPNQVSVLSVVFAGGAAACLMAGVPHPLAWFGAALCVQMRLLCNLMDGMLAVEGGLKSPSGDLYNEFPDRLADTLILAGLGFAGGTALSGTLGWLAACGALMTACVRMHGASLTGAHDFRGPMAKPHRMALATGLCLMMALGSMLGWEMRGWVEGTLGLMVAGIAVTLLRRLSVLSHALHERTGGEGK
jgi:phosphatidylglycerophosphate synthase